MKVLTVARCRGDFPKPADPSEYVPGKELTELLRTGLDAKGFKGSEIEETEYNYSFSCQGVETSFGVEVSLNGLFQDWWEIHFGLAKKSRRKEGLESEFTRFADLIDAILKSEKKISEVRWYRDCRGNPDDDYASAPRWSGDSKSLVTTPGKTPFRRVESFVDRHGSKIIAALMIGAIVFIVVGICTGEKSGRDKFFGWAGVLFMSIFMGFFGWGGIGALWGAVDELQTSGKPVRGSDYLKRLPLLLFSGCFIVFALMIARMIWKMLMAGPPPGH